MRSFFDNPLFLLYNGNELNKVCIRPGKAVRVSIGTILPSLPAPVLGSSYSPKIYETLRNLRVFQLDARANLRTLRRAIP